MAWISGLRSMVAGQKAKAEDVNFNFDKLEELLNGAFQSGRVSCTSKPALGTSFTDITGASTTLTVARASILVAVATFDVAIENEGLFTGNLNIDGTTYADCTLFGDSGSNSINSRSCVTQGYRAKLAAGSRTVKMVGKKSGAGIVGEIFSTANTGFTYFLYPDPEG